MRLIFDRFIFSLYILFLTFNIANASDEFNVDFYNVGQGHCCIVKTQKNGVIIIDAGSSSTIGIDWKKPPNKGKPLIQLLANDIFDSVKNDMKRLKKLNFIITHADKDHLNLAEPIVRMAIYTREDEFLKKENIQFILGGKKTDFTGVEAKTLIDFLDHEGISCAYGDEFTENNLLWYPPPSKVNFQFGNGEKIEFISVKMEDRTGHKTADSNNASSIVVRLEGGGQSVMITGDKTKNEIKHIVEKYKNGEKELKSHILLATHHGSREDFSEEWIEFIKPTFLVISSGISSFFHPRLEAVFSESVLKNIEMNKIDKWHPIRFYSELSSMSDYSENNLIPIGLGENNNFRNSPYSYSMTKLGIYSTVDQGKIEFSFNKGIISLKTHKQEGDGDLLKAFNQLLTSKSSEWSSLKIFNKKILSADFYKIIYTCSSLRILDLSNIDVDKKDTDDIYNLVKSLTSLTTLKIKTTSMTELEKTKIGNEWGHRGLNFSS